jgi:NAD(P)-dependent dehydrogenase (short-subunit alcohol dehydrogenase family)
MATGLLTGRTALITGAARGIGLAVARRYRDEGAAVAVADIDEAAAHRSAERLAEQTGARVTGIGIDVSDEASVAAAADATETALGPVDILVANAGILVLKPALDLTTDEFRRVLDVNLTGTFVTAREFGGRMRDRGDGGRIVVSSSMFGVRGGRTNSAYSASKFGQIGLVECLAAEWGVHGILVNAVCPGQIATDMMAGLIADRAAQTGRAVADVEADLVERIATGRMATPDEIADVYVFLASPLSRYVTGRSHVVDGGWLVG